MRLRLLSRPLTLIEAVEQVEAVRLGGDGITEVVGDKSYHSNQSTVANERHRNKIGQQQAHMYMIATYGDHTF
ncbi:MAG: hypothetical protein ACRD2X_22070 [Vicinamibacteraceae bacterium]